MFGNGFFAFHPFSDMHDEFALRGRGSRGCSWQRDNFPAMGRGPGDLVDKWMEILEPWKSGALVGETSPGWSRPRTRCCPHNCLLDGPRPTPHRRPRESLQHFLILPNILADPTRSDQQENSARQSEKGACCSQQSNEKDEASASGQQAAPSKKSAEVKDSDKARGESPWHFSVDMSGCDEVRAMTEGGMLMVEGRGSSDTSQQMVRYMTSLPRHVNHDSLTASLNNGRLTVAQKPGAQQLEDKARTLPIDVQQQQQQQQQQKAGPCSEQQLQQEEPEEEKQ